MRWTAIVLCVALVACAAKPRMAVRAGEVLAHTQELGYEGTARLATITVTGDDAKPSDPVNVSVDQQVMFHGTTTTLLLLLQGCAPFAGTKPCPLVDKSDVIYLRAFRFREGKPEPKRDEPVAEDTNRELRVIIGSLSLASLGGMGLCIAYCDDNKAAKSVALGGSALLFGIVWAIMGGNIRD